MVCALRISLCARLSACVVALLTTAPARAGELSKASRAVHGSGGASQPASAQSSGSSSESAWSDRDGERGDAGDHPLLEGALYVLISPFWIPNRLVERGGTPSGGWSVLARPYQDGAKGYLLARSAPDDAPDADAPDSPPPIGRRPLGLQLGAEGMPPLSGLGRVQARARLVTSERIELDAAYALYLERSLAGGATSAGLGQAHAAVRFAQSEQVQFRVGVGARQWVDPHGSTLGLDLLYGIDIFWGRPMTTSLEASGGTLGSAWAFEARATMGVVMGIGELYAGYDAIWIGPGGPEGPVAYLGGPLAGLRAYF